MKENALRLLVTFADIFVKYGIKIYIIILAVLMSFAGGLYASLEVIDRTHPELMIIPGDISVLVGVISSIMNRVLIKIIVISAFIAVIRMLKWFYFSSKSIDKGDKDTAENKN